MNPLRNIFLRADTADSGSGILTDRCVSMRHQILAHACLCLALTTVARNAVAADPAETVWQGPVTDASGETHDDWFYCPTPPVCNWSGGVPGAGTTITTVDNGQTAVVSTGAANAGTTLIVDNLSSVDLLGGSLTVANEELGQVGTGTFNQENGIHQITDFLAVGNLAGSTGIYNLRGGSLTVLNEFIGFGGTGTFTQTGGTHQVTDTLVIGESGAQGTYNLSGDGSLLTASNEYIGRGSGLGSFTQTGGTHTVSDTLYVGSSAGGGFDGNGSYTLNAGILNARNEIVADGRTGTFTQTGGRHTVSNQLQIGFGERGTYHLSGDGTLTTSTEKIGNFGTGTFQQTGGVHQVNGTLNIGEGRGAISGGSGAYALSAGILIASNENLGLNNAQGTFTQTGGTHSVGGRLTIGGVADGAGGSGAYNLSGGSLSATSEIISDGGSGTFTQSDGNHTVADTLTIGATGNYALSGGLLSSASLLNNGGFAQSGGAVSAIVFTNNRLYEYSGGTFSGSFVNNGTAVFNPVERAIFGANISGSGVMTKLGDGTLVLTGINTYSGGTTVSSGVLQGNTDSLQGDITNNATVVFDQAATGIYAGSISGVGNVVKENTGLLVFNGNNAYTGGTQVVGGNLQVGDSTHPGASIPGLVNVGPDGTLSGHGTINGSVSNSGTIAPGGSIGTLTINGNATFQSGSTFQTAIDPSRSSLLNVTGLASLGGAQVDVIAANGAYGPKRYTILSAGSLAGRFLDEVESNLASIDPLLTPSLAYDSNNVYLDLNPVRLQDPMGGATKVATDTIYMIDRLVTGRFNAPLGEQCSSPALGFWGRGIGMLSSAPASGDNPGYNGGTSGFVLGVDGQPTERLSLGIVGFSAHSDVTTNTVFTNRSTVNMAGFNLYGAYTDGAWQLRSALGYSNESYSSQQIITAATQQRRAQASTEANRLSNYTEGSYTFKAGVVSVQPLLAMQFGWMQQDSFTQGGLFADGQGLNVGQRTQYVLDTLAGARARQDFPINESMKVQVELRALYLHQFGTLQNNTSGSLTGGQAVSLGTQDRPGERDAGILGAGITLLTTNSVNVYLDYNGQILSSQASSFFSAGVRYTW